MLTQHHLIPTKPLRVVVLGRSGFIAQHLLRELAQQGIESLGVSSGEIDLCQPDSVEKLARLVRTEDALIVTSGLTPEKGRDVRTFMKNILMATHLCAFFEQHACRHVVYLSSDGVYSDAQPLVNERTSLGPKGLYAVMHVAREQMLESALAKPQIPLCIVRPCAVYGPGDTHNSYGPNRFIRTTLAEGKIALFGAGEEQRDHVFVRDVSRFLVLCLVHRTAGTVNITSGQSISFLELAHTISRLSPRSLKIESLSRSGPITHRQFDNSLRHKFFPSFENTPLETGLAATIQELVDR